LVWSIIDAQHEWVALTPLTPVLHLAFINWVPPQPNKPGDDRQLAVDLSTLLSLAQQLWLATGDTLQREKEREKK